MEEKTIEIDSFAYHALKKVINEEQENIYFRYKGCDGIIVVHYANKSKSNNANNEKNIVERWMNDIRNMAETGYQEARESGSERYFSKIKSYCEAVIVSVTS